MRLCGIPLIRKVLVYAGKASKAITQVLGSCFRGRSSLTTSFILLVVLLNCQLKLHPIHFACGDPGRVEPNEINHFAIVSFSNNEFVFAIPTYVLYTSLSILRVPVLPVIVSNGLLVSASRSLCIVFIAPLCINSSLHSHSQGDDPRFSEVLVTTDSSKTTIDSECDSEYWDPRLHFGTNAEPFNWLGVH